MIATSSKEEGRKSEKMVDGSDDLRTIESLRGRLLAERQVSRVANEEADQLSNKLIEVENQLKEETKMRRKAEKKLNFLKKQLESLKILPVLEESEQSSTSPSENCSHSCRSSTTTSISGPKDSSEESESKPQIATTPENLGCNVSESTTSNQSHQSSSFQERSTSMEISMEENQSEEEDYVDNSLALVPVSFPEKSQKNTSEVKLTSASVEEVLDSLRHAREKIQSSMERKRRHMIRVGPC